MLAGVSVDYYVRLEQGRDLTPSESVLDALARALRLDDTERAHLIALARPPADPVRDAGHGRQRRGPAERPDADRRARSAGVRPGSADGHPRDEPDGARPADRLRRPAYSASATTPAGSSSTPQPAASTSTGLSWRATTSRSCATMSPSTRTIRSYVSSSASSRWPAPSSERGGPSTTSLPATPARSATATPVVGEMTIHFEAMQLADDDQLLFIYSVEPGTRSHDAMRLLATWAATQDAEAAHETPRDVDDRTSPMT